MRFISGLMISMMGFSALASDDMNLYERCPMATSCTARAPIPGTVKAEATEVGESIRDAKKRALKTCEAGTGVRCVIAYCVPVSPASDADNCFDRR